MKNLLLKVNYQENEEDQTEQENSMEEVAETKEPQVTISSAELSVFLASMQKLVERISESNGNPNFDSRVIAKAVEDGIMATSTGRRRSLLNQKTFTKEDIPYDDILEKPATFMAFCKTTIIFDDIVGGHTMNIPYAPVVFKEFLRYQEPGTKDTIITQCVATVYSKAQAEFIRNHTFFNILYFEQLEEGKSYSSQVADKLVQCYETVRNMTDLQVKNKCLSLGIIINTTDFSILRKKLAQAMAKLSVEDNDAFQRRFIEDTNKFNELKQTRVEQTYS